MHPGEGRVQGSSFPPFPTCTTPEKQMPIRSSLSRIQLTASCPALDTPCSPADFSVSVPRIATCWGPPGASWSPHFSLLTPEEKKIKGRFYLCTKGHGQRKSLWWLRYRTVTSWNTRTGHIPKSLNYPRGSTARAKQRKVQDKSIHTEGLLAELHSLSEWGSISNHLEGKTKLIWVSGRNWSRLI